MNFQCKIKAQLLNCFPSRHLHAIVSTKSFRFPLLAGLHSAKARASSFPASDLSLLPPLQTFFLSLLDSFPANQGLSSPILAEDPLLDFIAV
jgi:hypothetical protein